MTGGDALDHCLRRLGGILQSPSLVMSYGHTTPRAERAWLRRAGLTAAEAETLLELMCLRGLMDEGAAEVIARVCRREGVPPERAARMLLAGEGWPDEGDSR